MTDAEIWQAIGTIGGILWVLSILTGLIYKIQRLKRQWIVARQRMQLRKARAGKRLEKTKGLRPLLCFCYRKC